MRVFAIAAVLLLMACNQVFDLRGTLLDPPPDSDGDGVPDADDNCPTVPNPDQANEHDTDAFGDACDLCPDIATAFNHDEDGDHVGDECDVCPGIGGFQDDSNGDGVGDTCQPYPPTQTSSRLLFDAFEVLAPSWHPGGVAWRDTGDAVAPVTALPTTDPGLIPDGIVLDTPVWQVTASFSASRPWVDGDRFGIGLADGSGALAATCTVSCTMGQCLLQAFVGQTAGSAAYAQIQQTYALTFRLDAASGTPYLYCQTSAASVVAAPSGPLTPTLLATPDIQVTYVDVVAGS